ncbi:MAG: hypothetical protein ABIP68_03240 [Ferruginibacter sp.]
MLNKYLKIPAIFILFSITVIGCTKNKNEHCISYAFAPVTNVTGNNTALVNQELNLNVSFVCINGCGQFGNFEESNSANNTIIKVNAKYEGCVCTQDVPTRSTVYKFKKSEAGIYELKFWQTDTTFYNYTIIVQ